MPPFPLHISAFNLVHAAANGREATSTALREARPGLRPADFEDVELQTWIGRVEGVEAERLPRALDHFDCRNHRLAQMALRDEGLRASLAAAKARYGAGRVGVFIGTSTSGIHETELAYLRLTGDAPPEVGAAFPYRYTHDTYACADFVARYLELEGPALVVSTACSSSAKVFALAARYVRAGVCDAALVGGVDSLCLTTLYGFNALELVSPEPCRPWDSDRRGINIGEAAGFALLEPGEEGVVLLGYGESSDAHHIATPHPEGRGAAMAMRAALARAEVAASDIDYVNLHGTATRSNDAAEDCAVAAVLGTDTACSSTKGWTGHTLGAAGIVEALFCVLALQDGFMPGSLNTETIDPALKARINLTTRSQALSCVMTNSFGFGGNNCSLVFSKR